MSSDGVTIKNDANTLLFTDDDVSDNFYSFEKSYHGVISQEMLNMFASLIEFNDLIGYPIDGYKRSYKEMEKLARLFFEKMENRVEPEKFFDFYKWIDSSIMYALGQLFPASAKFSETSRNVIESHVLERNKLDRKFPILIDVSATEGYARGINELFYNWKFGHAPVNGNENENCLWQKHRKERTDITDRQTLLDNLNSGNNSKHLAKFEQDGTAYAGSTYALRNFGSLHKFSVVMDKNIHGGTNYGQNKNRDILWDATHIHGPVSQQYPKGIPQNTLVVGLGEGQGTEAFIDCADVENPNEKRKWRFTTVAGRKASVNLTTTTARTSNDDYTAIVKGEIAWPTNVISASVSTGYQADVATKFKQGAVITNIHSDTYGAENDIGMQGPFTEAWVGGHQSRHIEINKYDPTLTTEGGGATNNNLGDQYSRPEGWRLLLRECADVNQASTGTSQSGSNDGAMGFVGPDYGGPYPDFSRQYAIHYREERAKRPLNVRNIKTTTGSARAGNFSNNYEVFMTTGRLDHERGGALTPSTALPSFYSNLPNTTQEASLVGASTGTGGNVVSNFNNTNRIPESIREQSKYDPNLFTDSIIATRFSAPGGFETMSEVFLDIPAKEYSAYNAMPFRNLTVRGSGSGEAETIRLNDHLGQRFGLQTHLRRHSGQFGYDPVEARANYEIVADTYVTVPSFHKIQRNTAKRYVSGASAPVVDTIYNNGFYQSCIPQSDFQYAWVTGSIGEDLTQRILGFAPAGGFVSSSSGYVDAIVFPSASQILGSL